MKRGDIVSVELLPTGEILRNVKVLQVGSDKRDFKFVYSKHIIFTRPAWSVRVLEEGA